MPQPQETYMNEETEANPNLKQSQKKKPPPQETYMNEEIEANPNRKQSQKSKKSVF